ncbi:MAG: PepSY-associated TM helix domain-containing protein [Pseudomonadota bacterium]
MLVGLHGWSAVVLGLVLYAVVLTGTVAVLSKEIGHWSIGGALPGKPFERPIDGIVQELSQKVGRAYHEDVEINFNSAGNIEAFFHKDIRLLNGSVRQRGIKFEVAPDTGKVLWLREGLGSELRMLEASDALFRFLIDVHVRLHLPHPWGLLLTGVLGLAMMVAAISGLLIHRHLIRDMFTIRGRGQRVLTYRDQHSVAGTWGLPFAFLLAFTGSFFSFVGSFGLPVLAMVAFGGDQMAAIRTIVGTETLRPGVRRPTVNLDTVLADSRRRVGSMPVEVSIENYGRQNSRIEVTHYPREKHLDFPKLRYDGRTGEYLGTIPIVGRTQSLGSMLVSVIAPLHFGSFGGLLSKAVWVALGLSSSFIIISGLQLWLQRRTGAPAWSVYRALLSIVAFGLPIALAGAAIAFLVARGHEDMVTAPLSGFLFFSGCATLLGALLHLSRNTHLWWIALSIMLIALPVVRLLTGGVGWWQAIQNGYPTLVALDLLFLIAGVACGRAAFRGRDRQAVAVPRPAEET